MIDEDQIDAAAHISMGFKHIHDLSPAKITQKSTVYILD